MNPALLRFLAVFTENLEKAQRELVKLAPSPELADPAHKELWDLWDLIDRFKENINDKTASDFIDNFAALKEKSRSDFFKEFEDNQIYTLKLLLHKSEANREFRLSSFAKHFAPFLQCPFEIRLEDNKLKFVFNAEELKENQQWYQNYINFFNALGSLGIDPSVVWSDDSIQVMIFIQRHASISAI